MKDTFPLGGSAGTGARAELVDGQLRVTAESAEGWPDGATATARVAGPDLQAGTCPWSGRRARRSPARSRPPPPAPTRWACPSPGPAAALLSAPARRCSRTRPSTAGAADPDALPRVSALAGGRGSIEPAAAFDGAGLPAGHGRVALAGWMVLAAALLWPVAVALGRVALHGSGMAALQTGRRRIVDEVKSRIPARPGTDRPPPPPRPPQERVARKKAAPPPAVPVPPPTIDRLLKRKRGESPSASPGEGGRGRSRIVTADGQLPGR